MPSALDADLNAIMDRLTGPGGPLATGIAHRGGMTYPMIVTAPPTLPALYARQCAQYAERPFLVDGDVRLSFAETHALALEVAQGLILRHAIAPGQRVAIAARNSAAWILAYMAVTIAGGCATLLNGWATGAELAGAIALADCSLVLADEARAARLEGQSVGCPVVVFGHGDPRQGLAPLLGAGEAALPDLTGDDLATILFTSGSTGVAKGAVSDHTGVVQATLNYAAQTLMLYTLADHHGVAPKTQPCALVAVPLFHVTGEIPVFLQSLVIGRKLVMMPKWDALEALRLIEAERVSYFVGVPLMSLELATHPRRGEFDLTSCSHLAAGGAPRPAAHIPVLKAGMPAAMPILGYGLTETNAVGCGIVGSNYTSKPDSTGPASRPLVELAIMDENRGALPHGEVGEVAIRSICNMLGYWRDEDATAAALTPDGWFLSGDLGRIDEDGYLTIVDRKKDVIIRGGENIAASEVEAALYAHPGVAEASVFGLPCARMGEVPVAVYLPRAEDDLDEAEVRAFLSARIATFKVPARIWRHPGHLPRLGTEKVDKRALKAHYGATWDG